MSEPVIQIRALALRDLESITDFIAEDSPGAAMRFLSAAERTFQLLASQPQMGTAYLPEDCELGAFRRFPVTGFQGYLIFYLPLAAGIDVVRVIHGARDIPSILEELE